MKKQLFLISLIFSMALQALPSPILDKPAFTFEGGYNYFIVSKSLLKDVPEFKTPYDPQGDVSLGVEGTSSSINIDDLPPDARIEKALLVWIGTKNSELPEDTADNSVILVTPDGKDNVVNSTVEGNADSPTALEFEGLLSKNSTGSYYYYYYVYRTDVTDIMKQYEKSAGDEKGFVGNYTVKGVDDIYDCIANPDTPYCNSASLVGGWQLILVYSSEMIARKRIYFYHGQEMVSGQEKTVSVKDFQLPLGASVKISFVTTDGDNVSSAKEFLKVNKGELAKDPLVLQDECNPADQPFNGKFKLYNYRDEPLEGCADELSYDVDTYILKFNTDNLSDPVNAHLEEGTTSFDFTIRTGSDILVTNYVILSIDTKLPKFDIPNQLEKRICTSSAKKGFACSNEPFTYEIKVQNTGNDDAVGVMVSDSIPAGLKYVPGSTKIDKSGTGKNFELIPDVDGKSALENGYKVTDRLKPCKGAECQLFLLNFKVQPMENPSKDTVYENKAYIWDTVSGKSGAYITNQGLFVRTRLDFACSSHNEDPCGYGSATDPSDDDPINDGNSTDSDLLPDSDKTASTDTNSVSDEAAVSSDETTACGCSIIG